MPNFHLDDCGTFVKTGRTAFKDQYFFYTYNSNFMDFKINILKREGNETNKLYYVMIRAKTKSK